MEKGLVSVIMPSWNTGNFIAESIQSVINQTYEKWELIIVDDCSTDNTDDVVGTFADKRIKYLKNEKNSGAALTRNRALREAKGEWIAFLDSDDLWKPKKLEHQLKFMKKHNLIFSYHEYVTFMYSAKAMGLVQIKDIKKNNDYAILLKLCKKADCYLLKENLAEYRIRKKSISHDKLSKKLKSHYDLFHMCDEKIAPVALWYACWNMFFGVMKKRKYEKIVK